MVRLEDLLKQARTERKLTIEEAAKATKIKPQFLAAIERGAYGELPSPAYARGFVRNYAEYLGLSKAQTSALFKRDFDEKRAVKVLPDGMVKKSDFPVRRINMRRIILGLLGFLLLGGFLLFQTRGVLFAPSVNITFPKEGSTVSREVEVKGKTDSNAIITINNDSVFVNNNGEFTKKVNLFPGKATITVKAKNRMGKESSVTRTITVK